MYRMMTISFPKQISSNPGRYIDRIINLHLQYPLPITPLTHRLIISKTITLTTIGLFNHPLHLGDDMAAAAAPFAVEGAGAWFTFLAFAGVTDDLFLVVEDFLEAHD